MLLCYCEYVRLRCLSLVAEYVLLRGVAKVFYYAVMFRQRPEYLAFVLFSGLQIVEQFIGELVSALIKYCTLLKIPLIAYSLCRQP